MTSLIPFGATVFMGFFAIMNPIANTPIFLGLTADLSTSSRRRVAAKSTLLAFFIVASFSIGGHFLFKVFGIGLPSFRMTGGILVFLVGKHLLDGHKTSPMHTPRPNVLLAPGTDPNTADDTDVAVSPLAIPILAGPGTIACAINFASGQDVVHVAICLVAFALLCIITHLLFVGGHRLMGWLGPHAIGVISRLMGLILAVIGVQMFVHGLGAAFPGTFH